MMKKQRGFTLIEIMLVVAILGIVASIAIPSVSGYLLKSRRSDAMTALMGLQHAQERARANCNVYAQLLGNAPDCEPGEGPNTTVKYPANSEQGWYAIAVTNATGTGYVATATTVAGSRQAGDANCKKLIIEINAANPNGLKTSEDKDGNPSTGCW